MWRRLVEHVTKHLNWQSVLLYAESKLNIFCFVDEQRIAIYAKQTRGNNRLGGKELPIVWSRGPLVVATFAFINIYKLMNPTLGLHESALMKFTVKYTQLYSDRATDLQIVEESEITKPQSLLGDVLMVL